MNYEMVWRLIAKDWYFQRLPILLSLLGGSVSLAIVAFGGEAGFTIGLILLVTIMVAIAAMLVMSTIIGERENLTLPFVMSLPISHREYTAAKLFGTLLIFVPFWLVLVVASLGIILVAPAIHGMFAFAAIMAIDLLVNTSLMIAVALVTESKGWTISTMMVGNVGINVVGYLVAHIPSIHAGLFGKVVQWTPAATLLVLAEFALIAFFIGGAFFIQSRKKDFL